MRKDLEEKLFAIGPRWFNRDPKRSCMGRGFECGDGWFALIESLLLSIKSFGSASDPLWAKFVVKQVKEKFGKLTVYYDGGDDRLTGAIELAEWLSLRMCEECGAPGRLCQNDRRFYKTLCPRCAVIDYEIGSRSDWHVAKSIDFLDLKRSRSRNQKARARALEPPSKSRRSRTRKS
jgi:hypothetical protein